MIIPGVVASSGGGGGYVASAVHFGGANTALICAALSCTDGANISGSCWVKMTSVPQDSTILWVADPNNDFGNFWKYGLTNTPQINLGNTGDTKFSWVAPNPDIADTNWHHILWTADTNHGAGLKIQKIFVDGVDATGTTHDTSTAFSAALNAVAFNLGDDGFGEGPVFDVADFWLAPNQSLLTAGTIAPATVAKFISGGKPVDLGADGSTPTGTAPAIFFSGDATGFATNQGTGGAFTLTGSLTNASSSPSD